MTATVLVEGCATSPTEAVAAFSAGAARVEVVDAAGGLPVTFHRAFDEVDDPVAGVEILVRAGITSVLTSGGGATAWDGRVVLRDLVAASARQIVVIGAGGVRGDHVRPLIEATGLRAVHARASAIPGIVTALR